MKKRVQNGGRWRPLVIGHRGARGYWPENSLDGFRLALENGAQWLEIDIFATADGVPVVTHDWKLNPDITRAADGGWLDPAAEIRVGELALRQLRTYKIGKARPGGTVANDFPEQVMLLDQPIPTLEEVLALAARWPDARLLVEIKSNPYDPAIAAPALACARRTIEIVRTAKMERQAILHSFDWSILRQVGEIAPELERSYLTIANGGGEFRTVYPDSKWTMGTGEPARVAEAVAAAGGRYWSPSFSDLTAEIVSAARELGLGVVSWTVNTPDEIDAMIALGVDGILSDYPARVGERIAVNAG